jgi:L-aminopeptidase/D-esterase-like protein
MPNDLMDPLFTATVEATEEAIINALVNNHDMIGRDNHKVEALPHARVQRLLKEYNRLR